ncbi:hypothetical protein MTO96_001389 [Rhipicephalus appendiculatus]
MTRRFSFTRLLNSYEDCVRAIVEGRCGSQMTLFQYDEVRSLAANLVGSVNSSCKAIEVYEYDKCAQREVKAIDKDSLSLESEKLVGLYSRTVVQSLRWTCFDNNCDNASLLMKLDNCDKIIKIGVLPSIRMSNSTGLVKACSYVKKFEWCIRQARIDTGCDSDLSVLNSLDVQRHLDKASEYAWICDRSGGPVCEETFVRESLKDCYQLVSVPSFEQESSFVSRETLHRHCRDVRAFKTCMQDILSSKCEDDPRMFHQWDVYYFRDLIGRGMNWTCFEYDCDINDVLGKLRDCDKLTEEASAYVDNTWRTGPSSVSCWLSHAHMNCYNTVLSTLCGNPKEALNDQRLAKYSVEVRQRVLRSCQRQNETTCNERELLKNLSACDGIVDTFIVPYSKDFSDLGKMATACTNVKRFQKCIHKTAPKECFEPGGVVLVSTQKYLREYYYQYNWICRVVEAKPSDPRCFRNYVNKKLKECEGLIVALPSPQLSKSSHGAQLEESCRALQDYVFCANMKLNKVCGSLRNNQVTTEARKAIAEKYDKHAWVCQTKDVAEKSCTKQGIVSKLKQCVGFLFVHVVKHATDYDVYDQDTCKYVQEYQQCVTDMLNTSCSRQAVLMKLDDVKYYTSHLYSKYEHLCRSDQLCNTEALHKRLPMCSGFITHKAAVNAVSKNDRRSLKLACSAVMDYQRCVQGIVSEVCQDRQYMPETADVKHYMRETCTSSTIGPASRTLHKGKSATKPSLKMLSTVAKASY